MMKRIAFVVLASASLFLAACASAPTQQRPPESAVDHTYVNTVEYHARRAGVRVEWVNPPRIRDRQQENG